MFNLRKVKALVATAAIVTSSIVTLNAKPADAYAIFEKPWRSNLNFTGFTQSDANQWCANNAYRATYYPYGLGTPNIKWIKTLDGSVYNVT